MLLATVLMHFVKKRRKYGTEEETVIEENMTQ